ncbi:glycosyltransferase family 4 protein [Geobacter sp. DSM 9736]|uniref:glycosyltransferase family 4 protein n=1 Tax=Geobacter sp. DSM 9736 TaxID=1277350 RepID=UPI000B50533D|nr:glycosyltransferase family 4 protein [Geobacter sp. DSM 9736]SNB47966.1 Glycosyltransferase involved in cell wall bisynthesis [Geobacter sp. DSM 9736]
MIGMDRLRIAFLSPQDPLSKKTWSGTTYSMYRALREHCGSVTPLGPAKVGQLGGKLLNRAVRVIGKRYDYSHVEAYARRCARFFESRLQGKDFDLIFAPAASSALAFLDTRIPIVYASDATFALLRNYYPEFSGLLGVSARQGNAIEQAALHRSRMALFSSEWAARSAVEDYGIPREKVRVVPFGANLESIPPRDDLQNRGRSDRLRLLFLAVDWHRKGGEIALETVARLVERGVDAELTVCGCTPPAGVSHDRMRVIPFLSKDDPEQMKALVDLFRETDFLLLPTRYDCTPVVICEANGFGVPVVTTDTGGISSLVCNNKNGVMLPFTARGDRYADAIMDLYGSRDRYEALRRSSRDLFERRLNWDSWALDVGVLFAEILSAEIRQAACW